MGILENRLKKLEANQPRQIMCKSLAWFYGDRSAPDEPFDPNATLEDFHKRHASGKSDAELMRDNPGMRIYR